MQNNLKQMLENLSDTEHLHLGMWWLCTISRLQYYPIPKARVPILVKFSNPV